MAGQAVTHPANAVRDAAKWVEVIQDGAEVPVREGSFVRIDPEATRCPVAGPEGMTFVAVGARPGAYDPRGPF